MTYLFSVIWFCLALAAAIGFFLGWLVRDASCRKAMRELQSTLKERLRLDSIHEERVASGPAAPSPETDATFSPDFSSDNALSHDLSAAGDAAATFIGEGADPQAPFPVEAIQGIGLSFGEKLRNQGVDTTLALLEKCGTDEALRTISESTGLNERALKGWTVVADLLRIPGMDAQLAQVLSNSGVSSVQELAGSRPIDVWRHIAGGRGQLGPETDLRRLENLVADATTLKPMIQR